MTNRCVKELVDFIKVFQILPRHVSASGCHLQEVVGALKLLSVCVVGVYFNKIHYPLDASVGHFKIPVSYVH
jgi:hypothetical protein